MKELNGLVLIGGKSARMQADKAHLVYHDKPQYLVCYDLLKDFCAKVFLSLKKKHAERVVEHIGPIFDHEIYDGMGPTGGILSAMDYAPEQAWFVLACDLPLVDADLISYLISKRNASRMATAFKSNYTGHPEPLCAIYEPQFKDAMQGFVKEEVFCPRKIMLKSDIELVDLPEPHALDNINTPDEFNKTIQQLKG